MRSLLKDRRGGTAVTFALVLLPILACVGAALDFNIYNAQKRSLQASVDAAALSVARLASQAQSDREALAATVVSHDFKFAGQYSDLGITVTQPDPNDLVVSSSVPMKTSLLGIIGIDTMNLSAQATVTRSPGLDRPLEFVFIMDTTASMHSISGSWDDAVDAIEWTYSSLDALSTPEAPVDMSFLPIGDRVNIGVGRSAWLSTAAPSGWNGCVEPAYSLTPAVLANEAASAVPAVEAASENNNRNNGNAYGQENGNNGNAYGHENGNNGNNDNNNSAAPVGQVYALTDDISVISTLQASIPGTTGGLSTRDASYPRCTGTLVGPTDDVTALTTAVRNAAPAGTGRFDEALAWGWRMVSPAWAGRWGRSDYPADRDNADKVIAIVTDAHTNAWFYEAGGANGSSPSGNSSVNNQVTDEGFEQIQALCQRIKDDGVTIYVLLKTSYARSVSPWQTCASPGKFKEVSGLDSFQSALSSLVGDVKTIRLKS